MQSAKVAQTLREFIRLWIYRKMYENKQNTSYNIPFFYKNRRKNDALCVFVTVYIYFDDWVTLPDVINDFLKLTSQW